jgi:hypothetical protein
MVAIMFEMRRWRLEKGRPYENREISGRGGTSRACDDELGNIRCEGSIEKEFRRRRVASSSTQPTSPVGIAE